MAPISFKRGMTPSYINLNHIDSTTGSGTFTQTYRLKPMTKKELIQTSKGRNRSKEPTEFWYYLFVCAVGVIVGVAVVDLVLNNQII